MNGQWRETDTEEGERRSDPLVEVVKNNPYSTEYCIAEYWGAEHGSGDHAGELEKTGFVQSNPSLDRSFRSSRSSP